MEFSIQAAKDAAVEAIKYLDATHNAIGTWVLVSAIVIAAHLLDSEPLTTDQ